MILAFGDAELDLDRYELRRAGQRTPIEPQVFDVLVHLASHAERVVSKDELLDAVWGDRFVSESALTSRIKAARRAVGDDGTRQAIIATAHGRGYRMVVPVDARAATAGAGGTRPAPVPEQSPADAAFLERAAALTELDRALEAARSGSGRVVWVAGEAGIGKSTLARRFAAVAAASAPVLWAGCDDLLTPRPLGPIKDLVDQLPAERGQDLADDLSAITLVRVLGALGADHGCVVVLEDLHWADDATLDVVRQVAARARALPVVLVLTYREQDVGLTHPLRRLVGSTRGPHVAHLDLAPLSPQAVARLAAGSGKDADAVFGATGGNPLFVTELIAAPTGQLPATVKDAVVGRLGELSPEDAAVLRVLSVVPVRVERSLTEVLCGDCDESLVAAEHRGILTGDASHVWFRHELVRLAVEDTLASSEQVRVHRQLARYLHERSADPARVVHHATRCHDVELLLAAAPQAARQASDAGAHRQAVQHVEAVLPHADRLPTDVHAALLTMQANSLYLLNHFDASMAVATEAVAAASRLDDRQLLAGALIAFARTSLWAVGPDSSQGAIERALAVLGDDGDPELRAIAHADLARAIGELVTAGSVAQGNPEALRHAEAALALAHQLDRPEVRGYALMYRGSALLAMGEPTGASDLSEAIEILQSFPRTELGVRACVNASGSAYRAGQFDQAESYVEHGLQLAKGSEFFSGEYRLALTRAAVRVSRGHWAEAERELRSLLTADGQPGIMGPLATCLLARVLARQGDHDGAAVLVAAALAETGASDEPRVIGPVAIAAVECAWLARPAAGERDGMAVAYDLADAVLRRTRASSNHTIAAELTRYLRWTGVDPGPVPAAPEPWASGLRGDWRSAAAQWRRRGEPYEEALELISGDEPVTTTRGLELLRGLGATGTIQALMLGVAQS